MPFSEALRLRGPIPVSVESMNTPQPEPKGFQVSLAVPEPGSPGRWWLGSGKGGHKPSTPLKLRGGAEELGAGLEDAESPGKLKGV